MSCTENGLAIIIGFNTENTAKMTGCHLHDELQKTMTSILLVPFLLPSQLACFDDVNCHVEEDHSQWPSQPNSLKKKPSTFNNDNTSKVRDESFLSQTFRHNWETWGLWSKEISSAAPRFLTEKTAQEEPCIILSYYKYSVLWCSSRIQYL